MAFINDADRVNFLMGREIINDWKLRIDHDEDKLEFKGKDKNVNLINLREDIC